jgi:hypothetical protein
LHPFQATTRGKKKYYFFSSGERADERGANVARGAKSKNADLDYEIEEREAMQSEGKPCQGQE